MGDLSKEGVGQAIAESAAQHPQICQKSFLGITFNTECARPKPAITAQEQLAAQAALEARIQKTGHAMNAIQIRREQAAGL